MNLIGVLALLGLVLVVFVPLWLLCWGFLALAERIWHFFTNRL